MGSLFSSPPAAHATLIHPLSLISLRRVRSLRVLSRTRPTLLICAACIHLPRRPLQHLSFCEHSLSLPQAWTLVQPESQQLLAICLKKLKGFHKVRLTDMHFIWTEPRSKRLKVSPMVQKAVLTNTVMKSKSTEQLLSTDSRSDTANYKFAYSVEIAPICENNLICIPPKQAKQLSNMSPLTICTHISTSLQLTDLATLQNIKVTAVHHHASEVEDFTRELNAQHDFDNSDSGSDSDASIKDLQAPGSGATTEEYAAVLEKTQLALYKYRDRSRHLERAALTPACSESSTPVTSTSSGSVVKRPVRETGLIARKHAVMADMREVPRDFFTCPTPTTLKPLDLVTPARFLHGDDDRVLALHLSVPAQNHEEMRGTAQFARDFDQGMRNGRGHLIHSFRDHGDLIYDMPNHVFKLDSGHERDKDTKLQQLLGAKATAKGKVEYELIPPLLYRDFDSKNPRNVFGSDVVFKALKAIFRGPKAIRTGNSQAIEPFRCSNRLQL
ncbi:hypothetical protein CONPUDRAFT_159961 [Coniophora puteana RWD-64-598 SS2]|uniref:60S ribosomal export protein NMD3 n=1 Tax=Coniophora puteana (strain RWD-64-598) TaxID=741705 RepID=R7SFM5_CONPW|nr:uncharacterized protein CONPUDRAFT_159961 [Coniophora puteana RWD-64-598 SS2]EIW74670.1 hypothetical protein CONPUDRAFT_159961 [Coniophora puteana RWD-64-598 SS2]